MSPRKIPGFSPAPASRRVPPWVWPAAPFVLAGLLHLKTALSVPVGKMNDDALFILLSRSLRHGAFRSPDIYARAVTDPLPGWPALLLAPAWIADPHWARLRLFPVAAGWLGLFFTWKLARKLLPPGWAASAALLTGLSPVFAAYTGVLVADVPFMAICAGLLFAFSTTQPGAGLAWLAAGAAGACLVRPQGALLALSLALAVAARDGWKASLAFLAAALGPLALWLARNLLEAGTPSDYALHLLEQLRNRPPSGALAHTGGLIATFFGSGMLGIRRPWLALGAGLAVLAAAGCGVRRELRDESRPWTLAMAAFCVLVLLLHQAWHPPAARYALPLVPLVWIFAACGVRPRLRAASAAILGSAIAGLAGLSSLQPLLNAPRAGTFWPGTAAWIRANTPASARIQSVRAPCLALFAERPAAPTPWLRAPDPELWLYYTLKDRVDYVVTDDAFAPGGFSPDDMTLTLGGVREWARSLPCLATVYRSEAEGSTVFRVNHPDPRRYLAAYQRFLDAARSRASGEPADTVRRKLGEALRLEPDLRSARLALEGLAEETPSRRTTRGSAAERRQ